MRPQNVPAPGADAWTGTAADGVLEQAPVGLALLDLGGAVTEANAALLDILGRGRDEVVGQAFAGFVATKSRDEVDRRLAKLMLGTARTVPPGPVALAAGGGQGEVLLAASRLEHDGELAGLIVSAQAQERRPVADPAVEQAQKLQAVGQLAAGVAHDFNNLLTAIIGFADLLLARHGEGDPSHDDVAQIRETADRGVGLVRQLLAFCRRRAANPVVVDPAAAIASLAPMLARLLGPAVALRLEAAAPAMRVLIDPVQLDQVILNLAVNARDAMPEGGSLVIGCAPHRLNATAPACGGEAIPPGCYVRLVVSDTGVGIPAGVLGSIFEPYFTTKGAGAGTGLGLATVHGIVREAGGFISVDSAPGRGTTFAVFLPRVVGQAASGEGPAPAAPGTAALATVLLVEDEAGVRAFAAKALRRAGYRVLEAGDGEAALAVLEASPGGVDVLVTDVMLPGIDGLGLARLVAQRLRGIRVILMSGCADEALGDCGLGAAPRLLMKPFSLPALTGAVAGALAAGGKAGG